MGNEFLMQKLGRETLRKVRVVEDALAHYTIDGDNVQASLEALRDLLDTDKVLLYSLAQRPGGEDLMVARDAMVAYPRARWRAIFEELIRGHGVSWGTYNALRPEANQRDVVLRAAEIGVLTGGRSLETDAILLERLGLRGEQLMRVLVCDGPSMLAWVGFTQAGATTERQRELLAHVVPAFRRRLQFERFVTESALAGNALAAAMEHVNGSAWVLAPAGHIAHANAAGRARFDRDPDATRAALEACVAGTPASRFRVAPLRDSDGRAGHMVVELPEPADGAQGLADTAQRFGLTPAQARVLERVARGISNATIAAELGVAERTVEAHVTAILVKAQVPSRAALIVQIFKERQRA